MISRKAIIERYLSDLRAHITQSPARDQRIEMLESELEEVEQVETLNLPDVINRFLPEIQKELDEQVERRSKSWIKDYKKAGYISGFCDGYRRLMHFLENDL